MPLTIFSGHTFQTEIVAFGQNYGTIEAFAEATPLQIEPFNETQQV